MKTIGKEENFVSIVVYIHNDAKILGEFLKKISNNLLDHFKNCELIVVNDFSQDDGIKIVEETKGSTCY